MVQAKGMPALQALDVMDNGLTDNSLSALTCAFKAGCLPELRELHPGADMCSYFNDSLRALDQAAPHLCALRVLDLGHIDDGAMLQVLTKAALPGLDTLLLLVVQEIDDEDDTIVRDCGGLEMIAGAPWAARLRTLVVSGQLVHVC